MYSRNSLYTLLTRATISLVGRKSLKLLVVHAAEEEHRVLLHVVPELWIHIAEDMAYFVVPRPPHVVCDLIQRLEGSWY